MRISLSVFLFVVLFTSLSFSMPLKRFSCGFSEPLGDELLERKKALSRAVSGSLSLVLENILGEDTFLELKDDVLLPILSNPERYLISYKVKEERKNPDGGYYVCLVCSFDGKLLYADLRGMGVLPEPSKPEEVRIRFRNLASYGDFEVLRDRVMGLEGVESFFIGRVSGGNGFMVAMVSVGRSRFLSLLKGVCEDLGLVLDLSGNEPEIDFKKRL